eukprot:g4294.t1
MKEWIEHNLKLVHMDHAMHKRPDEISGGMKQRVGIARALSMQPEVLLMDEPFGALDALTRAHMQDSLMEIQNELNNTVIMITHDVDEAVLLSDRIVMMTNGPAATIGEILDVDLERPRNRLALADDPNYNRLRAEAADARSSDFLLNGSYTTAIGKLVGYGYLLDDELRDEQSDTYGLRLTGSTGEETKFAYTAEFATQSITDSGVDFDTDYMFLEGAVTTSGVTAKLGYEVLGSDSGDASFTTPLATLHAFNGWTDVFLGGTFNPTAMPNGLVDTYISVGGSVSGFGLLAQYHMYEPDQGSGDYGSEWQFQATKALGGGFTAGLKYASYSEDGFGVDTDKLWTWFGYSF